MTIRRPVATRLLQGALALGLCGHAPLMVAQDAASAAGEELREVIISARSLEATLPVELSEYGNEVQFVTSGQILDHGFVDATQAIEMLIPGAMVITQAGPFSYVNLSMQGSRNGDVLWTLDGVRINNRLYNGTSPADTLPSSMIERLEVLKAGQGLLYGTQAVAGVINVVTRPFSDTADGGVSLGTDTHDGLHANGYLRGALGGHRFVAWASKDRSDGFRMYDRLQPNTLTRDRRYDVDSFGAKYGYEFTDDLRLTLTAIHTEAALDYPNVASTNVNDRDEEIVSGRLDYTPSEALQFFVKGYFHDWDTDYYPSTRPDQSLYWGYQDAGLSAAAKLAPHRGFEYHGGYDFQTYEGRDEVLLIAGDSERVHAGYVQLRTTEELFDKARFAIGVRHNRGDGENATVWSGSGVYRFSEALYLEGAVGTSFQLPDAEKLYSLEPDVSGNPNLEPEESFNVNLALGGTLALGDRPLTWRLSGWRRKVDNLFAIDSSDPPAGFDAIYVNIDGETKVNGVELMLGAPLTRTLALTTNYTYSRELARGTEVQLQNRPRRSGKLALSWGAQEQRFGADFALKYIGSTYATVTGFGNVDYGNYVVADIGAHVHLDADRRHRLGARAENVFDRDYATGAGSAVLAGSAPAARFLWRRIGAPRTGYLTYSYRF